MSRSYKKTPSCHIISKNGWMKKKFSRRVRKLGRSQDIPGGNAYRKLNDSYDIADWHDVGLGYDDFRKRRIELGRYADERRCRNDYERWYLRK